MGYKDVVLNIQFLPFYSFLFTDADENGNVSQEQRKNSVDIPHTHVMNSFCRSQSSYSSSGLLISPVLFAYNMLLIYTQSPVRVCVQVFVLSSGLRVKACIFECICASISAIFWVVKQEGRARPCPMVTYFINVYYASRDLPHWIWPSMHCIPPHALSALL